MKTIRLHACMQTNNCGSVFMFQSVILCFELWNYVKTIIPLQYSPRLRTKGIAKPFFLIQENVFKHFGTISRDIFGLENFLLSFSQSWFRNYNVQFALVIHFLHWCYTWTTFLSANQNRVIFFMCIFSFLTQVMTNVMPYLLFTQLAGKRGKFIQLAGGLLNHQLFFLQGENNKKIYASKIRLISL